jgi:hypothetical protein
MSESLLQIIRELQARIEWLEEQVKRLNNKGDE